MGLPSITVSDFSGLVNLTQDTYATPDFALAIPIYTRQILLNLVGNAGLTDIEQNSRARWDSVFNGTTWTNANGNIVTLHPVRECLINLIYAEYTNVQRLQNTNIGDVTGIAENSMSASGATIAGAGMIRQSWAATIWNETARPFLDYFRSVTREVISATGTGTIEVTVSDTIYLEAGDTVTIDGTEYTAANLTGTTFEVSAVDGSAFEKAVWTPFKVVPNPIPKLQIGMF